MMFGQMGSMVGNALRGGPLQQQFGSAGPMAPPPGGMPGMQMPQGGMGGMGGMGGPIDYQSREARMRNAARHAIAGLPNPNMHSFTTGPMAPPGIQPSTAGPMAPYLGAQSPTTGPMARNAARQAIAGLGAQSSTAGPMAPPSLMRVRPY